MTISPFMIYLWGQLDTITEAFVWFGIFSVIIGGVCLAINTLFAESDYANIQAKQLVSKLKYLILVGIIFFISSIFLPSSKTYASMVVIPAIANSQAIQRDLPEVYNLAVTALKEKLGQMPEAKK